MATSNKNKVAGAGKGKGGKVAGAKAEKPKAPKAEVAEEAEETEEEEESEEEEVTEDDTTDTKKANDAEDAEEEDEEESDEEDGEDVGPAVDVISRGKNYIRTYSKKVHGANYKELAKEFAGKPGYASREYTIAPSSKVLELIVEYAEKEDFEKKLDEQNPDSPVVEKARKFIDKDAALRFKQLKKGTCTVSKFAK